MPPYYPVYLDLRDKRCVVIGGGGVAERKVQGLLECDASVTVISPTVTAGIGERAAAGDLRWEAREYAGGDLKGVHLAIAAHRPATGEPGHRPGGGAGEGHPQRRG